MCKVASRRMLVSSAHLLTLAIGIFAAPCLTSAQIAGGASPREAAPASAAQSSASLDSASKASGSTVDQIEEIVVTALKRSENLQQVPVSVSVLTSTDLATMGIANVNGLALKVPSLTANENIPTQVSYKIRGLGNEADILTFEPEVALFFDGAYRVKGSFGATELMDVERIEVLKGSQSTLYGKNATAGVVNIVSAAPSKDFSAGADLDVDQYQVRNRGFVNGSLSEGIYARVSYFYTHGLDSIQDSLSAAPAGGYAGQQYGVRPQLLLQPNDRLSIRLIAGYADRHQRPIQPAMYYSPPDVAVTSAVIANPTGLAAADPDHLTDGKINPDARPFNPAVLAPNASRRDVTQYCVACPYTTAVTTSELTAIVDYDLDVARITAISSYDHYAGIAYFDSGLGPLQLIDYSRPDNSSSLAQEVRIASRDSTPLQWMVGGYFYRNVVSAQTIFTNGPAIDEYGIAAFGTTRVFGLPGDTVTDYSHNRDRLIAAFANSSLKIFDKLTLRAGIRYTTEEKEGEAGSTLSISPRNLGTSIVEFLASQQFTLANEYNHVTGEAGADFLFSPSSMIYGHASTAYKAGGFNLANSAQQATAQYKPEKADNFELGYKGTFLDKTLQVDIAAFYTRLNDYQAASFEGLQYAVSNADATTRGAEAEIVAKLGSGFDLDLNYAYVDAFYRKFDTAPCYPGNPNVTAGGCDLGGQPLPYSAKHRGGIGLSYTSPSGYYSRVDQFVTSSYNANTNLDPRSVQGGFGLTNARAGWRNGTYDFSLYVRNAFDKVYLTEQATAPATLGPTLQSFLLGHREIGGTVQVKF